jgi:isopentenyl-diphosphate Delta-isomerase
MSDEIGQRKIDHLALCATDQVAFKGRTNLLECVELIHQSLPELDFDQLDLTTELLGKTLRAPIVIAAMTGGTDAAAKVNHTLAAVAESRGYGFGLGSQRAMQRDAKTAWTYEVRSHAPTTLLLGNVGVVQARETPVAALAQLVADVGADALCLHMNPAQEMIQPGGDRDFRGCLDTFTRLVKELPVPVVAKETGNGFSRQTAEKLRAAGVRVADISGAGGTSWVGVETLRAEGSVKQTGELLWNWGIPTAVSVSNATRAGLINIATGGIKTGVDVARALTLGATAAGIARPALQAFTEGGRPAVEAMFDRIERELKTVMLLTGCARPKDLSSAPRVITGELRSWLEQLS